MRDFSTHLQKSRIEPFSLLLSFWKRILIEIEFSSIEDLKLPVNLIILDSNDADHDYLIDIF